MVKIDVGNKNGDFEVVYNNIKGKELILSITNTGKFHSVAMGSRIGSAIDFQFLSGSYYQDEIYSLANNILKKLGFNKVFLNVGGKDITRD